MSSTTNRRSFKQTARQKNNTKYLKTANTTTRLLLPPKFLSASTTYTFKARTINKQLGPYERAFRAIFAICLVLFFGALSGSGVPRDGLRGIHASTPDLTSPDGVDAPSHQHIDLHRDERLSHGLPVDQWHTQEHPLPPTQGDPFHHGSLDLHDIFDVNDPVYPIRIHLPEPEVTKQAKLRKTHRRLKNSL